jgi:hypothetical protein
MLQALEVDKMVVNGLIGIVAIMALAFCGWLANDLLWDRWDDEKIKPEARRLTWLIAANLAAAMLGMVIIGVLVLRTSVW